MKKKLCLIYLLGVFSMSSAAFDNPYPTLAIAEYVSVCIAVNSEDTFIPLQPCACSIDVIAEKIPYEKYVELEAITRMQQIPGEKTLIYKTAKYRKLLDVLHEAQIAANKKCFVERRGPK